MSDTVGSIKRFLKTGSGLGICANPFNTLVASPITSKSCWALMEAGVDVIYGLKMCLGPLLLSSSAICAQRCPKVRPMRDIRKRIQANKPKQKQSAPCCDRCPSESLDATRDRKTITSPNSSLGFTTVPCLCHAFERTSKYFCAHQRLLSIDRAAGYL